MSYALVSLCGMLVAVILATRGRSMGVSALVLLVGLGFWFLVYGGQLR